MDDVRSVDSINGRHPVIQAKREILVKKVRALVGTIDDADREGRRTYWSGAFPHSSTGEGAFLARHL